MSIHVLAHVLRLPALDRRRPARRRGRRGLAAASRDPCRPPSSPARSLAVATLPLIAPWTQLDRPTEHARSRSMTTPRGRGRAQARGPPAPPSPRRAAPRCTAGLRLRGRDRGRRVRTARQRSACGPRRRRRVGTRRRRRPSQRTRPRPARPPRRAPRRGGCSSPSRTARRSRCRAGRCCSEDSRPPTPRAPTSASSPRRPIAPPGSCPSPCTTPPPCARRRRLPLRRRHRLEHAERRDHARRPRRRRGATVVAHLPAPSSDQSAAAIGGTAYVVGGFTGSRWLDTIVAWRPGAPARVVAHLPFALRYAAVAAAADAARDRRRIARRRLGEHRDPRVTRPAARRVRSIGRLPAPTTHAAAAALGDVVYVIGGRSAVIDTPVAPDRRDRRAHGAHASRGRVARARRARISPRSPTGSASCSSAGVGAAAPEDSIERARPGDGDAGDRLGCSRPASGHARPPASTPTTARTTSPVPRASPSRSSTSRTARVTPST